MIDADLETKDIALASDKRNGEVDGLQIKGEDRTRQFTTNPGEKIVEKGDKHEGAPFHGSERGKGDVQYKKGLEIKDRDFRKNTLEQVKEGLDELRDKSEMNENGYSSESIPNWEEYKAEQNGKKEVDLGAFQNRPKYTSPSEEDITAKGDVDEMGSAINEKVGIRGNEDRTRQFDEISGKVTERRDAAIRGNIEKTQEDRNERMASHQNQERKGEMSFIEGVQEYFGNLLGRNSENKDDFRDLENKDERANWERYQYEQRVEKVRPGESVQRNESSLQK